MIVAFGDYGGDLAKVAMVGAFRDDLTLCVHFGR
jgi:hypothetical protein